MELSDSQKKQEKEGLMILLARALLAGVFPVITILAYKSVLPMDVLVWSTFFAAAYFAVLLTVRKKWHEIRNMSALKDIFWIVVITGVTYQMLFFIGLNYTSAGNASIIALTEIMFSYMVFNIWKKEYMSVAHIFGLVLIVAGVVIILSPKYNGFHGGDLLIMLASVIAPFGNIFQRKARNKVSVDTLMFVRSVGSGFVLLIISAFLHNHSSWIDIKKVMPILVVNGILMLGLSKSMWIEAIHRVSVAKANAMGSIAPVFTLLVVWIFIHTPPTNTQIFSLAPILAGFFLLNGIGNRTQLKNNA